MNSNLSDETISVLLPVEGGVWCGGKRLTFVSAASSRVQISGGDAGDECQTLFVSSEESQIWAGWETGAITIHDLFKTQGRTMLSELHQHSAAVTQIVGTVNSQNGPNVVISTSEDGQIVLWNESLHHVMRTMQVDDKAKIVTSHLWGTVLIAGCSDQTIQLWDILEGEILVNIDLDSKPTALTTDKQATLKTGSESTLGSLWSGLENGVVSVFDLTTTEINLSTPAHNNKVILITPTSSETVCSLDSSGCFVLWSGLTQLQRSKGVTGNYQVACLYEKSLWMGKKHAMGTPLVTCRIEDPPDKEVEQPVQPVVKLKPNANKMNYISKQLSSSDFININIDTNDVVSRCSSASIRSDSGAILNSQLKERLSLEQQKNSDLKNRNNEESQMRTQAQQQLLLKESKISDLMRENLLLKKELDGAKQSQLQNEVRTASIHGLQNELVEAKLYIRVLESDLSKREAKTAVPDSADVSELQTLKDQLAEALSCSKASRDLCEQYKSEHEELRKSMSKNVLNVEVTQLQSELSMSEELAALNEERISDFKRQESSHEVRISELKELLSSKETIITGLEESISSLKKKQKQSVVTNTEFNTLAQTLQQQASSLKRSQQSLQEDRNSLQTQIDCCISKIIESNPSSKDDSSLVSLLNEVLVDLSELRSFKDDVSSLITREPNMNPPTVVEMKEFISKLHSIDSSLHSVEVEFFSSNSMPSESPTEIIANIKARLRSAPSHGEFASLKETLANVEAENETLRESFNEAALQAEIATLRAENSVLKSGGGEGHSTREIIKSLSEANDALCSRSESQQTNKDNEIATLRERIAVLEAENSAIRETNNSLRRTTQSVEQEVTALRESISSLEVSEANRGNEDVIKMQSAQAVAHMNKKTGNTITSIIAHTQEEISDLHLADSSRLEFEKRELQATLDSVNRSSQLLRIQNEQLVDELNLLKSKELHDPDSETKTSLRLKNAELEDTIASYRSNLSCEGDHNSQSTITSLQRRNIALEAQTTKLKEKRRTDKNAMKSLHTEVVDLAEKSQSMYDEMKKTESERKGYQQLSQQLQKDVQELKDSKTREVEAVKKQHAASIRSNRETEHRVANVANELATVLAAKEQEHRKAAREETLRKKAERKMHEALSSRSGSASSLQSEALTENVALRAENSRLQSELSRRESETPSAKGRSVSSSSAKELTSLRTENSRLQSELSRRESETPSAKGRSVSDSSAKELTSLRAENSRLQSDLTLLSRRSESLIDGRSASDCSNREMSTLKAENERLQLELSLTKPQSTDSGPAPAAEGSESPELRRTTSEGSRRSESSQQIRSYTTAHQESGSESGLVAENTFLKAKIADLKRSLTASTSEITALQQTKQLDESDAYLKQLAEENSFLMAENEELRSQIEEMEVTKDADNSSKSSELEEELKRLKETNQNLIEDLTTATTELTVMKEQLVEASEHETHLITEHEVTQQELAKTEASLHENKKTLEKLTLEVSHVQERLVEEEENNQNTLREEFSQVVKELDTTKEQLATEKKRRKARTFPSSITLSSPGSGKLYSGEYNITRELHGGIPIYKTTDGKILTGAKKGIKAIHKKSFIISSLLKLTMPTTYNQPWVDQVGNNVDVSIKTVGRIDICKEIQQTAEEENAKTDEINLELDGIKKELVRLQRVEATLKQLQNDHNAIIQIIESISEVVQSDSSLTSEFVIMGGDRMDWLDSPSLELEDRIKRAFIRNYIWGAGESRFPKELRDAPTLPDSVRLERALQREELLVAEDDVDGFTDCSLLDDTTRTVRQRLRDTLKRINSRLANRLSESDVDNCAPVLRPALVDDNSVPRALQDGSSLPLSDRLLRTIRRERWRISICSPQLTTQPDDPTLRSQLIVALQRESWLAVILPIPRTGGQKLVVTPRKRMT